MKAGTLYIVATPIGNLKDITLRALDILKESGLIICEDTRVTAKLLKKYGISAPSESYHKFNEKKKIKGILDKLMSGAKISLVSDAGTPLLSDPGYLIVKECIGLGIDVEPVPGPSSVTAALVLSGFNPEKFCFRGFVPRKAGEFEKEMEFLEHSQCPVVYFESPNRVDRTLRAMALRFHDRQAAVIKEMTKIYEKAFRGTPAGILSAIPKEAFKGEFVIVVDGAGPKEAAAAEVIQEALEQAVKGGMKKSEAVKYVASKFNVSRNRVYEISIKGKEGRVT